MRTLMAVSFTALTTILIAAGPSRLDSPKNFEPPEISRLDECIQVRFLATKTFGMSRVLPRGFHGIRMFQPENSTERAVVSQLKQKGYEVAFYLAGRNTLTPSAAPDILRRSLVQGPAYITPLHEEQLPNAAALLADSRDALISFETSGGYDIRKAGWTVAMRPLRASNETCVQCHIVGPGSAGSQLLGVPSQLKIGDPLGVAMYVYRQSNGN